MNKGTNKPKKFEKILIANRGEIALRVMRAARELDIKTVAVYSTADKDSLHVKFADEAVCIGRPSPRESYLSIPAIISAAEVTAADAIHPGYGFLSENAHFAEVCEQCGFTFIGPSPELIRKMGDKIIARQTMAELGIHSLPGSKGPVERDEDVFALIEKVGFPILIKAAAGGGGRGMKIVRSKDELSQQLGIARTEAKTAFGNDAVYVEKFIERPKHIEFQIAGDLYGNVVHMGERECSVQRRYQKLIEEASSMAVSDELRSSMGAKLCAALSKLGYHTLGTIELIMDGKDLYFMEMNTRVQVEHPVTEMAMDLDLVRLQLKLAMGEEMPYQQQELQFSAHAIECRINAEHPETFAPSPGVIQALHFPGGNGVRVESFVTHGSTIVPYYDSLIAKIIVRDTDRNHAIHRMQNALKECVIQGIETNISFHQKALSIPSFVSGDYSTLFVQEMMQKN